MSDSILYGYWQLLHLVAIPKWMISSFWTFLFYLSLKRFIICILKWEINANQSEATSVLTDDAKSRLKKIKIHVKFISKELCMRIMYKSTKYLLFNLLSVVIWMSKTYRKLFLYVVSKISWKCFHVLCFKQFKNNEKERRNLNIVLKVYKNNNKKNTTFAISYFNDTTWCCAMNFFFVDIFFSIHLLCFHQTE